MAEEIKNLEPKRVWEFFYDLTQIPRPTGQTLASQEYVMEVGRKLGLEVLRDEVGNVLIRKPATPGREGRPVVTLQAHLDMVPQKNSNKEHDFTKDPIDALIDGEWVRANATTLGADNGIGVSYALAVLSDATLEHGPLEALFTVDEEVGMVGANGLKPRFSQGDILINLDSEDENEIFVGCAGGVDVNAKLEYKDEPLCQDEQALLIELKGLKGGHSGMDIILGRGNANKLLARVLKDAIRDLGVRLSSFQGGSLRNAIPREAKAVVTVAKEEVDSVLELVSDYEDVFKSEYQGIEDGISLKASPIDLPETLIPEEIQDAIIDAVDGCINGPLTMLQDFPGVVETSSNIASVVAKDGVFEAKFLVRSSSESKKYAAASSIESIFSLAGAEVEFSGAYNGWNPNANSPILKVVKEAYKDVLGIDAHVQVIHAGLECGIIQGAMPEMDMVSIGPSIRSPHSPDERVDIASVERTWRVLKRILELV